MSVTMRIDVTDSATPALAAIAAGLGDRAGLHESIGRQALALTKNHLIKVSLDPARHKTADKLGATRSDHWGRAADNSTMRADSAAATITIKQVGIGRALHDVMITPKAGKKWLTIPLVAEAYNQRAYRMQGLFFAQPKGRPFALLGRKSGGSAGRRGRKGKASPYDDDDTAPAVGVVTWVYLLVKSVFQRQDRKLLPSEPEFLVAADIGVKTYLQYLRKRRAGGNK